jgi:hypothetical protein
MWSAADPAKFKIVQITLPSIPVTPASTAR